MMSSEIASYSPISTLERQYASVIASPSPLSPQPQPPLRLLLFASINANCCLAAGVETILQQHHKAKGGSLSPVASSTMTAPTSDSSLADNTKSTNSNNGSDDDPFSFLRDTNNSNNNNNNTATTITNSRTSSSAVGPKFGNFFKKVAQQTTQTLERGVQGLAIRADKGKSPDLVVLGLYDARTDRLISCTETQPVPYSEQERMQGLVFHIPLTLLQQQQQQQQQQCVVTLKLWIQSGATLLGTKVAKHYLLGQATVTLAIPNTQHSPFAMPVSYVLQSNYVVNGQVQLLVARDLKWPTIYTPGWSLCHPNYQTYTLYHPPLDQSYAYRSSSATLFHPTASTTTISSNSTWCIATERAIESTVVLPVATAVMELAHQASLTSLQHATGVLQQTISNSRHDLAPNNNNTNNLKATCQLQLYHSISVMTPPPTTAAPSRRLSAFPASYYVRVSWQRPDCVFEMELLPLTSIPSATTQIIPTNNNNNNNNPMMINLPFFPKVCWTHPHEHRSKLVPGVLSLWEQHQPPQPIPPYLLGTLRIEVVVSKGNINSGGSAMGNPFDPIGTTSATAVLSSSEDRELWQNIIALEPYVVANAAAAIQATTPPPPLCVRLFHTKTGQVMGSINMHLNVILPPNIAASVVAPSSPTVASNNNTTLPSARGGLVSFMGLDNLMDDLPNWNCPQPILDYVNEPTTNGNNNNNNTDPQQQQQHQQILLASMGLFVTYQYLQQHIIQVRTMDVQRFSHLAQSYRAALLAVNTNNNKYSSLVIPAHLDRSPKPFRPSSSRMEDLLSAIAFNVHIQTLDITMIPPSPTSTNAALMFQNITCGAPADHARGFGNVFKAPSGVVNPPTNTLSKEVTNSTAAAAANSPWVITSPIGSVAGGLRRLEAKRLELAQVVQRTQSALTIGVASFQLQLRRQLPPPQQQQPIYIPARHFELTNLRWKVYEAVQALHHVTWLCAIRRAHCFSQVLGVALSSYLTAISNTTGGWPDVWVRHGYLITYEGLLSAAGKELGMIEDASVAIAMLRNVSVVLVPVEDVTAWRQQQQQQPSQLRPGLVEIPESPHLVYLHLTPFSSSSSSLTQYRVEIGMDANYYRQSLPEALQRGTSVTFYPLLFQVGVDIRQWGAHAGNHVKNQLTSAGSDVGTVACAPTSSSSILLDDDADDEAGMSDDDVLVQLNYEALRKLNAYVHALYPQATPTMTTAAVAIPPVTDLLDTPPPSTSTPQQQPQQQQPQQIHSLLTMLHGHILSSSGKMNHSILDEAATIGQQLGGGGVVFCKSGKDRTAMQVTYKQAQFLNRVVKPPSPVDQRTASTTNITATTPDTTLQDATLMRIYGTRLPICEKNVGQAKYAFNSLQVQFMPEALKPPPNTLAGFLKGGRLFGKGGGIES